AQRRAERSLGACAGPRQRGPRTPRHSLLDLDAGAGLLELPLDRVSLVLGHALLDRLGRAVNQVLGLLEAQAGECADDLDHLDLLGARTGQDDVEGGLLLDGGSTVTAGGGRCGDRDRRGGRDAPLVLDLLLQLDEVEHGQLPELVEDLVDSSCSHRHSSVVSSVSVVSSEGASASGSAVSASASGSGAASSAVGSSAGASASRAAASAADVSPCACHC